MGKKNVSKETIIEASIELLHEKGLAELTMRNLAAKLGIKAPALYWYIKNKQELLQLLSEYISAKTTFPEYVGSWEEQVIQLSLEIRRSMLSVPDGAEIMMETLPTSTKRLQLIENTLQLFKQAQFPEEKLLLIAVLLNNYVTSHVLDEQKQQKMMTRIGKEEIIRQFQSAVELIPPEEAPLIHKYILSGDAPSVNEQSFLVGLQMILNGLKQEVK